MASKFTEQMGLYGWSDIEPVLLAALASEYPILLIGKHGCAKSFILERLAKELKMEYRFYNSSLINYDDLVGIPIPTDDYKELKYISGKESIWDSEIVFIDEINRCKIELQNKLFPIIYDKRIQGVDLSNIKYRWAAMNPPSELDDDYLGANELDKALADRFPFIIKVKEYSELSSEDKVLLLKDVGTGFKNTDFNFIKAIGEIKDEYKKLKIEYEDEAIRYINSLSGLLINRFGYISCRRVTMLYDTLFYIFASLKVLDPNSKLEDAMYLHIKSTLPMRCSEDIDDSMLNNLVSEAISISEIDNKELYFMKPGTEKLIKLINYYSDIESIELNEIICNSISSIENTKERMIMALFTFIKMKENIKVYASTMETLYELSKGFSNTESTTHYVYHFKKMIKNKIDMVLSNEEDKEYYSILSNILNYFGLDKNNDFNSESEVEEISEFIIRTYKALFSSGF